MKKLIFTIVTTFVIIKVMGCSPKSIPESRIKADPNLEQKSVESQQLEPTYQVNLQNYEEASNSNRAVYQELPLPLDANLVGTDAKQIALNIFGIAEPVEGNFQEEVSLEKQSNNRAIVNLTQTGLPDDSVEGTRYRLEFIKNNAQWRLDWVGRQVRCYPERGSQVWSTEKCR